MAHRIARRYVRRPRTPIAKFSAVLQVTTFYLTCAAIGGVLLLAQLVLGAVGAEHHDVNHDGPGDGLQLLSVRAISAGVAFFGIAGLSAAAAALPVWISLPAAVAGGVLAMLGVALLMRSMLGLQRDATVHIESSIGLPATVYVPVPPAFGGTGKVLLSLNGRTVEYEAVTPDGESLPTGTAVLIVDVRDHQTVEVVLPPNVDGVP